jgi:hypothetical protein
MRAVLKNREERARTGSRSHIWAPVVKSTVLAHAAGQAHEIARVCPSNAVLLELAQVHRPPQEWWDAQDDPFQAQ